MIPAFRCMACRFSGGEEGACTRGLGGRRCTPLHHRRPAKVNAMGLIRSSALLSSGLPPRSHMHATKMPWILDPGSCLSPLLFWLMLDSGVLHTLYRT